MIFMEKKNLKMGALRMDVKYIIIICAKELIGGYSFGGNSEEIFEKFFGCSNPFA